jgi:hypothetical protein
VARSGVAARLGEDGHDIALETDRLAGGRGRDAQQQYAYRPQEGWGLQAMVVNRKTISKHGRVSRAVAGFHE